MEKEARWRNLIQAKYGSQPFDLKAVDTNSASSKSPWKYIMKQKDLIYHNIQCKPGKGASTTFWSGTCCNLQLVYSNLFCSCKFQRGFHCPCLEQREWSMDWNIRRNSKDEEISKWASLSHLIPSIFLTQATESWFWKLNNSEIFASKSLYAHLINTHQSVAQNLDNNVWKTLLPKKNKIPRLGINSFLTQHHEQTTETMIHALGSVSPLHGVVYAKKTLNHTITCLSIVPLLQIFGRKYYKPSNGPW